MIQHAVLEYAINSIWQVPMLAALVWLLIWLGRPGARTQHGIWLAALALAVLLPLRGIGARASSIQPAAQSAAMQAAPVAGVATDPPRNRQPAMQHAGTAAEWLRNLPWLPLRRIRLSQQAADWLLGIYLLAVFFRLTQLGRAWRAARRLVARAKPAAMSESERAMLARFCQRFDVSEPRILISREAMSPLTLGVVRPVLVLPETFSENLETEMMAVLCHELAHIRRRDYRMNLLCHAGALPIAYHPATHAMQRRIRQTREMVCDAMAADTMQSASGYARCLIALAQRMLDGRGMAEQMQGMGLFDNNRLEERIMRLLETKTKMSVRARVVRVAAGAVLITAGIATATIFHVAPTVVNAAQSNVSAVPDLPPPPAVRVVLAPSSAAQTAQAAPAVQPALPPAPAPLVAQRKSGQVQPRSKEKQHRIVIVDGRYRDLTPEERAQLERNLAAATARIEEATRKLQSPEFKQQMADMQQKIAEATKKLQSAEMQRQMHFMQSPEFKQQMEDMQEQVAKATSKLRSAEVQRQMQFVQSPEFKQQMADMQQKITEATKKLQSSEVRRQMEFMQSSEFKQQMEDMQEQVAKATSKLRSAEVQRQMQFMQSPEFKKQMEDLRQTIQRQMQKLKSPED